VYYTQHVSEDVMLGDVSRGVTVDGTTLGGTVAIKEAGEMRGEVELRDEVYATAFHDELISMVISVSIVR
jgi:ribose 5-phosphate isomerase RpiB